jgi:tetratricopeptide (TPR) repeat protein
MNDLPRQKLGDRIREYGQSLWENPRRLKAFLIDDCRGQYKREIFVLVSALEQGIATDLLRSSQVPTEILLSRLIKRIQDDLGLSEEAARYAVESWAQALDKMPQQQERQEAVTEESEANSRVQENAAFYCQQGKEKLKQSNYNQARSDFNQAIALDPNCADAYYGRGEALLKTGGLGGAIKDFQKASELYFQQGKIEERNKANKKLDELIAAQKPPEKPQATPPVTPTNQQPPVKSLPNQPSYSGSSSDSSGFWVRLFVCGILLTLLSTVPRSWSWTNEKTLRWTQYTEKCLKDHGKKVIEIKKEPLPDILSIPNILSKSPKTPKLEMVKLKVNCYCGDDVSNYFLFKINSFFTI